MKKIGTISILMLMATVLLTTGMATAGKDTKEKPYTLSTLTEKIGKLEKKEVALTGTIIGVCKSGCKMWVAEGEYKKGNPFVLVRAKDDAFKFDTKASGKKVILYGYAVAKYMDYCAETGVEQEGAMKQCETPVETAKESPKKTDAKSEKKQVKDVTFFATKVEYIKS